MNLRQLFFTLVMALLCASVVRSEETDFIHFVHVGLDNGLSQSTVFSIDQDASGSLWLATYDGVNKYDGYNFTIYHRNASDPNSLANDISRIVKVDSKDRVWVGTRDGLSLYNRKKDSFKNYFHKVKGRNVSVTSIVELTEDCLMLGTSTGVLLFQTEKETFVVDKLPISVQQLHPTMLNRQGDHIYIGTDHGLYIYSLSKNECTQLDQLPSGIRVQSVLHQSAARIWIATEGAGLFLYNSKEKTMRNFRYDATAKNSICSNFIRSLTLDKQNRLWVGTFNGLSIYSEGRDGFTSYTSVPMKEGSLSQSSVRSIFMDAQGGMWLGTYYGGLNYYHPLRNRFKHIKHVPYQNSVCDNVISCISEDNQGNLWIGTNDGGMDLWNKTTKQFTNYSFKESGKSGVPSNNIKTIYIDSHTSKVYIGAHAGGLTILDRASGRVERLSQLNSGIPSENVYSIVPDGAGNLWLGTLDCLAHYDVSKRTFTVIDKDKQGNPIPSKQVNVLLRDRKGRLWVGGETGLAVYNLQGLTVEQNHQIKFPVNLQNAFINGIYEAKNGRFWIATREGLYAFEEKNNVTVQYTVKEHLPSNVVYGTLEDSYGRLWMSTNHGLACLNPESGKFRNFTEADGLQSNQFNTYSYCRTADGQMFFGGINGITAFQPELLVDNPYTPPVIITDLQVFNKAVHPDDATGILSENISETKKIVLSAAQNSFSLAFVVSNYIAAQHNTFEYKLEGFDKEWYTLTDARMVSYSNLPSGTYTFLVKAANNDGKWNETPTELIIEVLPVWYRTWWATLIFLAVICSLAVFVIRFFWLRKSMQAEIEMERKEKEHQEELSQTKIRFYINISHELRTPLTLILAPLQEVMAKVTDRWMKEQLDYIHRNANRLLHLVNQLMDYRRAELGIFELKVKREKVHERVLNDFLYYDRLAQKKSIDYNLYSEVQDERLLFDGNYLDLILNNLLSNAFKYTKEGDSITVRLTHEQNNLVLQVVDTGIGIPLNKQGKVFERFYQIENEHVGSGIGLSLVSRLVELHHGTITLESEEGKGSTFSVYLPQDESLYAPEEFVGEEGEAEEERAYSTNSKEMYIVDTENAETPEGKQGDSKRGSILIVEDNQEIRHYISNGLSDSFITFECANGEEALALLKEQEVDAIITDVMMPVMDGIKLCKQVKQNIRTCHIPVYILSAKSDIKYQLEGLQVGADDYIPKPFSLSVLSAKLQNMLRTRYRSFERFSNSLEIEPEKLTTNVMDEELLKRAIDIVEKNMSNVDFSTDQFAQDMNMSRSTLHLKLKAITGKSAIDFIHKIRFGRACELLKEGRYTVSEVSFMVGYNTPSYFATRFKKYIGCLPTEYLKGQKEK